MNTYMYVMEHVMEQGCPLHELQEGTPSGITPPLLHSLVACLNQEVCPLLLEGQIPILDLHVSVHVYSTS